MIILHVHTYLRQCHISLFSECPTLPKPSVLLPLPKHIFPSFPLSLTSQHLSLSKLKVDSSPPNHSFFSCSPTPRLLCKDERVREAENERSDSFRGETRGRGVFTSRQAPMQYLTHTTSLSQSAPNST